MMALKVYMNVPLYLSHVGYRNIRNITHVRPSTKTRWLVNLTKVAFKVAFGLKILRALKQDREKVWVHRWVKIMIFDQKDQDHFNDHLFHDLDLLRR